MNAVNSTDATRGLPLAERVILRMAELEAALTGLDDGTITIEREAVELALAAAKGLTTGDLEHPGDAVAHEMNTWLERNKYLAEVPVPPRGSDPAIEAPDSLDRETEREIDEPLEDTTTAPIKSKR